MGRAAVVVASSSDEDVTVAVFAQPDGSLFDTVATCGYATAVTNPSTFSFVDFVSEQGRIYPQYEGRSVWDVRLVDGHEDAETTVGMADILAHSEFYEREGWPPHYIALYCQQTSRSGGELFVIDGYAILERISEEMKAALRTTRVTFSSEPSIRSVTTGEEASKEVLSVHPDGSIVLQYDTSVLRKSEHRMLREFSDVVESTSATSRILIPLERGSLVIWDNFRMLHGRTMFSDKRRWLQRICFDR